ncbi:Fur family transcriptional regulator [Ligilactobacillus ceti]|uniref:Ferric uptake regulation protein n=1 Tax=Ligilactobacillus ceti DSM 22408 TaxID=1122146 RepID=A0A0R2KSZ0_9LACO|nr:Fur family transcriptional regulator [Ligilactobacillus ceti]KRN89268.1 ferric uptake regulation protein [Ligilactobacillus ceti DSM 22408]
MVRDQEVLIKAANKLKDNKIKNTPQRQVILAYLMTSKEHPSINMIYNHVINNGFSVSLATVYNTLEILLKKDLIIEVAPDNNGHMRYDYFENPHYHVICIKCNKILDIFDETFRAVEEDAAQKTGFKIINSKCEVYGVCPDCQDK